MISVGLIGMRLRLPSILISTENESCPLAPTLTRRPSMPSTMYSTVVALGFAILVKSALVGLTLSITRPHLVPFVVPKYLKWFQKTP